MKFQYLVQIDRPENHLVKVTLKISDIKADALAMFLPSWSPGSYLMREYSRHIRYIKAEASNGVRLNLTQTKKAEWKVELGKHQEVDVIYEIYLKELTVRTSHVDASHAFLHGPSYLIGVLESEMKNPKIEFNFPPVWSKISTSLKATSQTQFSYTAANYDELIDCPVEIGCHETDGFMFQGKKHELAFYGVTYPHQNNLKKDFETIVAAVAKHFDNDLPYENYLFLTHFSPKLYGGLEHLNSTALHYDGRKLSSRKDYLNFLSLVAHEYFHLWNVKRIRPVELGPFDYQNEAYTSLLWLAEGLTSFMDDLFIYRANLSTLEEYLEIVKGNFELYFSTPGRKFHSLEDSSFNAWIKLYRPDENSKNSSVSYYLKGGLVFMCLHALMLEQGSSVDHLLKELWIIFKTRPEKGVSREEIYELIEKLAGKNVVDEFSWMVETTRDIPFEKYLEKMGLGFDYSVPLTPSLGVEWEFLGERVLIKTVITDGAAYKCGLNAGDEILAINGLRFLKEDADKISSMFLLNQPYQIIVSRLGKISELELMFEKAPSSLKEIKILDRQLAEKSLNF